MREMKTIEVDRWVPSDKPGMVKHAGMISPQAAFDALEKHLKEADLMPDEYFSPNTWAWGDIKELPNFIKADCNVNWGGSEGIYLDVSLLYRDEKSELQHFNLATGKTLGESGDDFLKMSRIAAECSMMLNGRGKIVKFYEDEKEGQNKLNLEELNKDELLQLRDEIDDILERMRFEKGTTLNEGGHEKYALIEECMEVKLESTEIDEKEYERLIGNHDFYEDVFSKAFMEECGGLDKFTSIDIAIDAIKNKYLKESLEERIVTAKDKVEKESEIREKVNGKEFSL